MTMLAPKTLQAFFTDRLTKQKNASDHTVASYRDTLRLRPRNRLLPERRRDQSAARRPRHQPLDRAP
jgi:hypothetical protein